MAYNRRDYLQHWVRKDEAANRPCQHACCRGYRQHPENLPLVVESRRLRRYSDDELVARFTKVSRAPESPQSRRAEAQILAELQRRDDAERRRNDRAAASAAQRFEREQEAERIKLDAEARTQGYLVTREGQARGITDAEILTGREATFIRYATPEAKAYFAENPRPTGAYLRRGADTRVAYSDRPTRRPRRRAA